MKKQTDIAKDRYKFLKDQINVNDNNREDDVETEDVDNRGEDMSGESNITKDFDAVLKDIRNNEKNTKSVCIESCGSNINLHPLIIKLLDAEKNSAQKRIWI